MKFDLQQVSEAVEEALGAARREPERDITEIRDAVITRTTDRFEDDQAETPGVDAGAVKMAAHRRLHAAAESIDAEGAVPHAAQVNATIGVGLALLANGEDAETFYAAFLQGGHHGA